MEIIYKGIYMNEYKGLTITINLTEKCNLNCKYCYEVNKSHRTIEIDKIYRFIDLILSDKFNAIELNPIARDGLIIEFIGGEALLEFELVDKSIKYLMKQLMLLDTPNANLWRDSWRISISTNGTLFHEANIRKFCEKYRNVLSLSVSIDGCPSIHDKYRVDSSNNGSIHKILSTWNWYKNTFPIESKSVKSTLSRDSIPYLFDSLVFLHESLGITEVNQNFILEDMKLTDDDLKLLDEQFDKCITYCELHKDDLYWSMIDYYKFACHHKMNSESCNASYCGSGSMPCLSIDGNIYPCFRWCKHSTNDTLDIGNLTDGIDLTRAKYIQCNSTRGVISNDKCRECEFESSCSYCIAQCYNESHAFIRSTHICEVTKLQCKWAKIYWSRVKK